MIKTPVTSEPIDMGVSVLRDATGHGIGHLDAKTAEELARIVNAHEGLVEALDALNDMLTIQTCKHCDGDGITPRSQDEPCPHCNGLGDIVSLHDVTHLSRVRDAILAMIELSEIENKDYYARVLAVLHGNIIAGVNLIEKIESKIKSGEIK